MTADVLSDPDSPRAQFLGQLAGTLMVVPDVAEMLGLSRQRVLKLIQTGKLDAVRKGRVWLISALSVQELIDVRRQATQEAQARRTQDRLETLIV